MKRLALSLHCSQYRRLPSQTFLGRIFKVILLVIISILGIKLSNVPPSIPSSNLRRSRLEGYFFDFSSFSTHPSTEEICLQQQEDYLPGLKAILHGQLVPPDQVGELCEDAINLGLILINLENSTQSHLGGKLSSKVTRTLESMLTFSSGTPINLVVLTDQASISGVSGFLGSLIARMIATRVVLSQDWRWRRRKSLPDIKVTFVDSVEVVASGKTFVKEIQGLTSQAIEGVGMEKDRYVADLFYMAPLYPRAFVHLKELLVIDATDLLFHCDVLEVYQEFDKMKRQGALLGIGRDLSPNYHYVLTKYRAENPGSRAGLPGDTQGLNTGVVLYRLEALRSSDLYSSLLEPGAPTDLARQFMYPFTLAEQDWFTNVALAHPHLVHVLPCELNRQTSIQWLHPPYEEVFEKFHSCPTVKVRHLNGCGPRPQDCKIDTSNSVYWQNRTIYLETVQINFEIFWLSMARVTHLANLRRN